MKKSIKLASVLICALGMSGATFAALPAAKIQTFEVSTNSPVYVNKAKGETATAKLTEYKNTADSKVSPFKAMNNAVMIKKGVPAYLTYKMMLESKMMHNGNMMKDHKVFYCSVKVLVDKMGHPHVAVTHDTGRKIGLDHFCKKHLKPAINIKE